MREPTPRKGHPRQPPRTTRNALVLAAVLLVPTLLGGCIGPFKEDPLLIVGSAPKESSGLTIFAKAPKGLLKTDDYAEYEIRYGERTVFPPGGRGAIFPVEDGAGTAFLPYNRFVVGNGDYDVIVRYNGAEERTRVNVEKWVSYVYLKPMDRGNKVTVDVQLSRATGGMPNDRVMTKGELLLEIRYRGEDGEEDRLLGAAIKVETSESQTFTRVEIPRDRFNAGSGYYSVEPVFHNRQAKGNLWVPKDPTLALRDPPANWVRIN